MHLLKSVIISSVIFLMSYNCAGQEFVSYDKYIRKAQNALYSDGDTISAIKHFQEAFRFTKKPFSEHTVDYYRLNCDLSSFKNENTSVFTNNLIFQNDDDKNLFLKNNCFPRDQTKLLNDNTLRQQIDRLLIKDQAIDRSSENKKDLFIDVMRNSKIS